MQHAYFVFEARLSSVAAEQLQYRSSLTYVQGDWFCPSCLSGASKKAAKVAAGTAREHYLGGGDKLALVQIQALWQEADGSCCFAGRWYELPEGTHTGRQVNLHANASMCCLSVFPC